MIDFASIVNGAAHASSSLDNIVTLTSAIVGVLSVLGSLTTVLFFIFRVNALAQSNKVKIAELDNERKKLEVEINNQKLRLHTHEVTLASNGITIGAAQP